MSPRKAARRPRTRWTGADSTIVQMILIFGMLVVAASFLYTLVWITPLLSVEDSGWMNQVTVDQPDGAPDAVPGVAAARGDVTVSGTGDMVLTFGDPSTWERFMLVLPALLRQVTSFTVAYLVLKVIQSLSAGDPFNPANVRRVYGIAITVLAAAVLWAVADGLTAAELQRAALGEADVVFAVYLDSGFTNGLLVGFLLAALAEVFRRGTRMREDVKGLV